MLSHARPHRLSRVSYLLVLHHTRNQTNLSTYRSTLTPLPKTPSSISHVLEIVPTLDRDGAEVVASSEVEAAAAAAEALADLADLDLARSVGWMIFAGQSVRVVNERERVMCYGPHKEVRLGVSCGAMVAIIRTGIEYILRMVRRGVLVDYTCIWN